MANGCCVKFAAFIFALGSLLVAALGAAVIAVAALVERGELNKYFPPCSSCKDLFIALYVLGAVLLVAGVLGIAAGCKKSRGLAIPFTGLMGLGAVAFLGLLIVVIIFDKDPNALHLDSAWVTSAEHDPDIVCRIEKELHCSGYNTDCSGVNGSKVEQCPTNCDYNDYSTHCQQAMVGKVNHYLGAILGVIAGIVVLCILLVIMGSCLIRNRAGDEGMMGGGDMEENDGYGDTAPLQKGSYDAE